MKNVLFSLSVLFLVSTLTVAQDVKEFDAGVAKFRAKDYDGVIDAFSSILARPDHNKRLDEDLREARQAQRLADRIGSLDSYLCCPVRAGV